MRHIDTIAVHCTATVEGKDYSVATTRAQTSIVVLTDERDNVIGITNKNAEAVRKADDDRRGIVAELEIVQAEIASANDRDDEIISAIIAADSADDGAVAPVLEDLRKSRFGGAR